MCLWLLILHRVKGKLGFVLRPLKISANLSTQPLLRRNYRYWRLVSYCGLPLIAGLVGCGRPARGPETGRTVAAAVGQTSATCRECHATEFAAWSGTDHALANRLISPVADAAALAKFSPPPSIGPGTAPDFMLGHKPLGQPVLPAAGRRWQVHELAFDPAKQEWFNVFGQENRQPGEWGHWTGRGMNWNSMCAHCHMTGYRKNYDDATDSYYSTWVEHGVGCIQCHGPTRPGHGAKNAPPDPSPPPFHGNRQKMMQTCAPCHARNEQLTLDFQPGDNYADHYRITLPVDAGTYYPDGQQRDEDFNWTSALLSRMGHAEVTCLDCHDPHSTKTILPTANNQLCLQCHAAPGRVQHNGTRAVPIDPVAHSHHAEGSTGNSCVACHMPTTNYMQRAPRHDHGWLRPDPLLTKELAIPNACSRCHADKPVEWVIASAEEWYGAKMDSRQRARARAIAAAQTGRGEFVEALLMLLKQEDIPAWKATYLLLLVPEAQNPVVAATAQTGLADPDPLVRSAAVRVLTGTPQAEHLLPSLLRDPVRLVRLDAEWALSTSLTAGSPERKELDAYLALSLDQPSGRLRFGQDLANRGQLNVAEKEIAQAAAWDPYAPGIFEAQAIVLAALGRTAEAGSKFSRAAELAPADPTLPFRAGLTFAEASRMTDAEKSFRLAVARDPKFDRAWYNLGLLLAQTNRLSESAEALSHAENIAPNVANYPYALSTLLLRTGDRAGARDAALRTLRIDPAHPGARQIMRGLP